MKKETDKLMMRFPVLAFKERGDISLYGYKDERSFRRTSRELLKAGIFENAMAIDSNGKVYKFDNIREIGWANKFWGFSIVLKGRQILIDFDADQISQKSFQEVKNFCLERMKFMESSALMDEINESVRKANSIEEIINLFV